MNEILEETTQTVTPNRGDQSQPKEDFRMRLISTQEFEERWAEIQPLLNPATEFNAGEYETEDLRRMVQQGLAFGLGFLRNGKYEYVMVMQTIHMPRKKVLFILSWGGHGMRLAFHLFYKEFIELMKQKGYQAIRGAMRPSMERYAKRMLPNLNNIYSIVETSL
jgi:hypothetical protein